MPSSFFAIAPCNVELFKDSSFVTHFESSLCFQQYDHDGGRSLRSSIRGGVGPAAERNQQSSTASTSRLAEFPQQSPQQLLNDLGSDEKVREGNAKNLLLDFFGI